MKISQRLLATTVAAMLAGCAANKPLVDLQSKPVGPSATPQRNLTHFAGGLRCMDDTLLRFGVRDLSMMIEEMQDNSRKLGAGTRDMMVSAISDMTRRSRGVRLVTFGQDNQNVVNLINLAQRANQFKVVPQYDIRGSVTQFDEDVVKNQAGIGASLTSLVTGPLFGIRFNSSKQVSVLGFDASIISTDDLSLVPGVSSKNVVMITKEETSAGDGTAQIRNGNLSFSFTVGRSEGTAQALRNMVELATIELVGKLVRVPYWTCLNIDQNSPEVKREVEDWFVSMQGTEDLAKFLQEQLRNRKFYDGPVDSKANPAYEDALAAYRKGLGLKTDAAFDVAAFTQFLVRPVPPAPKQLFTVAKAEAAKSEAKNGTIDAPVQKATKLTVRTSKQKYRKGEPVELTVTTSESSYLYCFIQSPSNGKIQRIFPNRFVRDPRVEANQPLVLPGAQGFKVLAGGEDARQQIVGCLATARELYNELPPQLRWGDFEDIRLGTLEEIRDAFAVVSKGPVAMDGALIDISEASRGAAADAGVVEVIALATNPITLARNPISPPVASPLAAKAAPVNGAAATANTSVGTRTLVSLSAPNTLKLNLSKAIYRAGDAVRFEVVSADSAYLYCYLHDTNGRIQRIFPNRFASQSRIEAGVPVVLPGTPRFALIAEGGAQPERIGCIATGYEITNNLPEPLRRDDFADLSIKSFEEIAAAFTRAAQSPLAVASVPVDVRRDGGSARDKPAR
ncbi:MAG: DUF4384 domain-containing protein [Burkholderiales bacterium]